MESIQLLQDTINVLSKEDILPFDKLSQQVPPKLFSLKNNKRFLSHFYKLLDNYKISNKYGRLRAGILLLILFKGEEGLRNIEMNGLLLPNNSVSNIFLSVLNKMFIDMQHNQSSCIVSYCRERLQTYINFCNLNKLMITNINKLNRLLKNRPPSLIKSLIHFSEIYFLEHYYDLNIFLNPNTMRVLNIARSPEDFASIISFLIWKANSLYPLQYDDFISPIDYEDSYDDIYEIIQFGSIIYNLEELSKAISCFQYRLHKIIFKDKVIFKLASPNYQFEYFRRLSYVREELAKETPKIKAMNLFEEPQMSLFTFSKYLIKHYKNIYTGIEYHPIPRVLVKIPYDKDKNSDLYIRLMDEIAHEDLVYETVIMIDYLIPKSEWKNILITPNLNLSELFYLKKFLNFICYLMINSLTLYKEMPIDILNNSLLKIISKVVLVNILRLSKYDESKIQSFINLFTWKSELGSFYDMQYSPLLEKGDYFLLSPGLFSCTNFFRNVQVSNKLRIKNQGEKFVELSENIIKTKFRNVVSEKPVRKGDRKTDIDIVVLYDDILYLFECKYSVPPTNYHELRDIWRDVLKGVKQLILAKEILENPAIRQQYLGGWFPGIKLEQTKDLNIKVCVLTSNFLFSGMSIEDVPIRDFRSFVGTLEGNPISFSVIEPGEETTIVRYSIHGEKGFSREVIDNYLSKESNYYKLLGENMVPVTRVEQFIENRVLFAQETYYYKLYYPEGVIDWIKHMEQLGFHRLPDEKRFFNYPLSLEQFEATRDSEDIS